MKLNQISATEMATTDLAKRLSVDESEVESVSVTETEFPDMSLGASIADEMAAQMLVSGWTIILRRAGKDYEYRATKYELRLVNFDQTNYVIQA